MTNQSPMAALLGGLAKTEDKFQTLNESSHQSLSFKQECSFAKQLLINNEKLFNAAQLDPQSLNYAIGNVASIGISLNPANAHAYLVPRKVNGKKRVCLDIGYRGLIKLATDSGCVKYLKAEIVHENDEFEYFGFDRRPEIAVKNPFDPASRGDVIGVIAWAKLHTDDYICEMMSVGEIQLVQQDSEAFKYVAGYSNPSHDQHWKYKASVWVKHWGEMAKKTVIKRLYKTLPQSKGSDTVAQAIEVLNEHEGISFDDQQKLEREIFYTAAESADYERCLDDADYTGLVSLLETLSADAQAQLTAIHETHRMPDRGKGKYQAMMQENIKVARELREDNLNALIEACTAGDDAAVTETIEECGTYEIDWYLRKLNNEQEQFVSSLVSRGT